MCSRRGGLVGRRMRSAQPTRRVLQGEQIPKLGSQQHVGRLSVHEHLHRPVRRSQRVVLLNQNGRVLHYGTLWISRLLINIICNHYRYIIAVTVVFICHLTY